MQLQISKHLAHTAARQQTTSHHAVFSTWSYENFMKIIRGHLLGNMLLKVYLWL